MPIQINALREAAGRPLPDLIRSPGEAKSVGAKTAFLCHSHRDSVIVQGFLAMLLGTGWRVYVDWQDGAMPDTPNRDTARRIQQKIVELSYFFFLATPNGMSSKWCPWEIGYADGKKPLDQIIVVPTTDGATTYGNEYLQLYRRLDISDGGRLAVWGPAQYERGVLVESL